MKYLFSLLILTAFFLNATAQEDTPCVIDGFSYELERESNQMFYIKIEKPQNLIEAYFVYINGEKYEHPAVIVDGAFYFGPFPIDCTLPYTLYIEKAENPNCNITANIGTVCPLIEDCGFVDIKHEVLSCNDEGAKIKLGFTPVNTGNLGFDLINANGEFLGFFYYQDLPITFEINHHAGDVTEIIIQDNDNPACHTSYSFIIECDPNECKIYDVEYSLSDCTPNNAVFMKLDFEYQNTDSEYFTVKGNGQEYGKFKYADLPIELGPFAPHCDVLYEFVIQDEANPECKKYIENVIICCPIICEHPIFEIVGLECTSDLLFMKLELVNNQASQALKIFINNMPVTDYEIDFPYIYITHPNLFTSIVNNITICTPWITSEECCHTESFTLEDCVPNDECRIGEIEFSYPECNGSGAVMVTLDFKYENPVSDQFVVKGNGNEYGVFSYNDLPIEIGPIASNCNMEYEFVVYDSESPNCSNFIDGIFICCPDVCIKPAFEIVDIECGDAQVWMKLELLNPLLSDEILIMINNYIVEEYEIDWPYIYLTHPVIFSGIQNNISICVPPSTGSLCCYTQSFTLEDCIPECEIGEIKVEEHDCNDGVVPYVLIDFEYAHVGQEGFSVFGNGINYGQFKYEELPVKIPVTYDCTQFYEFVVIDNQYDYCSNYVEYGPLCCDDQCSFVAQDIRVRCEGGIITEVAFYLFEATDPIKTYEVFVNDELIGIIEGNNNQFFEFPTQIPINPNQDYILTVCDESCCKEHKMDISDCAPAECDIYNISTTEMSCTDNGLQFLLNFEHIGTNSGTFDLYSLFGFHSSYSYDDLPVKIEGFPYINFNVNILFVCDNDSFCCGAHVFQPPQCSPLIKESDDIMNVEKSHIFLKQNPINDNVFLVSPYSETNYTIFDSEGNLVRKISSNEKETIVNANDLDSGLYFVQIQTSDGIKTEKLIISK